MRHDTGFSSQTIGDAVSDIEDMADFREVPDYPFWEVPGFVFDDGTVEELKKTKKKIWKVLSSPDYTSTPNGSSENSNHEAIIKNRVRNNVALLFRGLVFFKEFHSTTKYFADLSADKWPRTGETTIKALESIFVKARRAYVAFKGAHRTFGVARFADHYIKFLDSSRERIVQTIAKTEVRGKWASLKKKGAFFNLAQHSPDDVDDDSDDDEILTLPGERRSHPTSKKRKNSTSAPQTPIRPSKRPSTSSVRRATRRARVVSPSSSPPLPRFDSSIGLTSDPTQLSENESIVSSSVYSPLTTPPMPTSRSDHQKIHERLQVIDLKISRQEATLVAHDHSIESLKVDVSLRNEAGASAQLTSTVRGAVVRLEKLEEKKKKSEKYISHVVRDQLSVFKSGNEERLNVLDARLDSTLEACAGNHAVEEAKRKDIKASLNKLNVRYNKLREAVKRHRDDHKKLGREVNHRLEQLENNEPDAESDQNTDPEEEGGEGENIEATSDSDKSRIAVLEEELAALKQSNEKQHARLQVLEEAPSLDAVHKQGDDLEGRVTAQEEEIARLKEGNRQLKEEMAQNRRDFQKPVNEIGGLVQSRIWDAMRFVEEYFGLPQVGQPPFPPQAPQGPRNPGHPSPISNRPATIPAWKQTGHDNGVRSSQNRGGGSTEHQSSPRGSYQSRGYWNPGYNGAQGGR